MNDKNKNDMDKDQHDLEVSLQRFDELLKHGTDKISRLEIDEFSKGLTHDELKKILNENVPLSLDRSDFSTARKSGALHFEECIQYIVSNSGLSVNDICIEEVEKLASVTPGQKIASIVKDESNATAFNRIIIEYDKLFQQEAGITVRNDDTTIIFSAARGGKVIYLNNTIRIISADRDASCEVHIDENGLKAAINIISCKGSGRKLTISLILDKLEEAGVIRGIGRVALEEIVAATNADGSNRKNIVAATGQSPVHGKDGALQLHTTIDSVNTVFKILPDGRVDYRKQASINMVNAGDHIATIGEPEAGVDGFTVRGEIIPAQNGTPCTIFEGDNVRRLENSGKIVATAAGMLSLQDNVLSVFPMYHVNSDVDFRSGNISFNGSVLIQGTVRTGFEVKASGDVIVLGSVESAHIEAGRDIRINGAIIGGTNSIIKAGRDVFAGHVQNARVEAQGDVNISRSIMHSTVYSTGKVITHNKDSSIVGGVVHAMRGFEVMSVGSSLGTPTEIVGGSDYLIQRKIAEFKEIERFYKENILKIDTVLRPLMELVKKGIPLGSEKKRRLSSIVEKRNMTNKSLQMVQFRIDKMSSIDPAVQECVIIIQKNLYQDVTIRIGQAVLRTREDLRELKCSLSSDQKSIECRSIRSVNF